MAGAENRKAEALFLPQCAGGFPETPGKIRIGKTPHAAKLRAFAVPHFRGIFCGGTVKLPSQTIEKTKRMKSGKSSISTHLRLEFSEQIRFHMFYITNYIS